MGELLTTGLQKERKLGSLTGGLLKSPSSQFWGALDLLAHTLGLEGSKISPNALLSSASV